MMSIFSQPYYLYGYIAMVFVAMRIPYLGVIIRVFNTLIHESAHASMAMLTSGKILKIELQNDTSGTTLSVAKNKRSQFLVAIVGYPLAAAAGYLLFWAIAHAYNVYALYAILFLTSFVLLFYVRNFFGILWSLIFISILAFILWLNQSKVIDFAVFTLAVVLATEAIYSSFTLFVIAIENPADAGDAKLLSSITKLPAFFWALFFVGVNGWIVYRIVVDFLIFAK
jgi:hypothetical protein